MRSSATMLQPAMALVREGTRHWPAGRRAVMGSSLGGAMGIAVTASLFALFLPLGMAHAAQYALWFNAVLCLGAMAVSALLLPRTSHS